MRAARIVLWVAAVVFIGVGLLFLIRPEQLAQGMGVMQPEAPARTEIRAVYGGIELALGVFFAIAARHQSRDWLTAGLVLAALVGGGAGLARVVGFVVEGEIDVRNVLWGTLELVGAVVAAWVARRMPK